MVTERTSILFLTADPSDEARLRLGKELREIQTRLRLASAGDSFDFHHRTSVRPGDLTQAIFDTKPAIVHFSGHGSPSGELLLENDAGEAHPVTADALQALFSLCKAEVRCVILNSCHSWSQGEAIAKHIDYVIGMTEAIGDEAAIAFSVGFYKALGAGRSIRDCFEFGRTELQLLNIAEHNIPTLVQQSKIKHLFLDQSQYKFKDSQHDYYHTRYPSQYHIFAKFHISNNTKSGSILIDPDSYSYIGHFLDDIYLHYLRQHVSAFSYGIEWALAIGHKFVHRLVMPWQWFLGRDIRDRNTATWQEQVHRSSEVANHGYRDIHSPAPAAWQRKLRPSALGIERGCRGEVLIPQGGLSPEKYVLIASNDDNFLRLTETGPKTIASLLSGHLASISPGVFNGTHYRHNIIVNDIITNRHGIFTDGELSESERADLVEYWLR